MSRLGRVGSRRSVRFARVLLGLVTAIVLIRVGAWALPWEGGAPGGGGNGKPFDHGATSFPLVGPHAKVACESCHPPAGGASRKWVGVPKDCHSCHGDRTNHRGTLGSACEGCHSVSAWKTVRYGAASHHLPLNGPHDRPCAACHGGGAHLAPAVTCNDCHEKRHGGTDAVCATCHATTTWHAVTFKHAFPPERLPGPHLTAPCLGCHAGYHFKGTSFACASCHEKDLKHDDLGECGRCHDAFSWRKKSFNHNAPAIGFALEAKHAGVACDACHTGRAFASAPRACEGCHLKTPHADLGPCAHCHTTATFSKPGFSHATTRFPLDERHAKVGCADCHARVPPGTFTPGPSACEGCHRDPHGGQFAAARDGAAHASRASRPCADCHVTRAFVPSTIDLTRHASFGFALRGAHARAPCAGCHQRTASGAVLRSTGPAVTSPPPSRPDLAVSTSRPPPEGAAPAGIQIFAGTKMGCKDCHQDHHEGLMGQGPDCATCHAPSAWKEHAPFDHKTKTGFALEGAHSAVACAGCHLHGDKLTTPNHAAPSCAACHHSEHGEAFSQDCRRCHDFTRFADARNFDHAATSFPLERRHASLRCASCHKPKVARLPDQNCSSCHGDPHGGRTFLDCGDCHRPDNWLLVRYDHDKAEFPLKGKHFFTPCKACHTNDVWSGLRRECVSCHRGDRQQADLHYPSHAALTWDCIDCHRPWSWNAKP